MNNGIRLNNFEFGINDNFKTYISNSKNINNLYESLFDMEFNIIFGNNYALKDKKTILEGNNFKNIIDRINLVIDLSNMKEYKDISKIKSYYIYDKNIFTDKDTCKNNMQEQNKNFSNIMTSYLKIFSKLNVKAKILRRIFMEVDIFVLDKDKNLIHLLEFISNNIDNENFYDYSILLNELQREVKSQLNSLIRNYGGFSSSNIQYWMPFILPDKYCITEDLQGNYHLNSHSFNFYANIIKSIKEIQTKLLGFNTFYICGPNTSTYKFSKDENDFLYNILYKNISNKKDEVSYLKDLFHFYTFYSINSADNLINTNLGETATYNDNKFEYNEEEIDELLKTLSNKEIYFTNQGISLHPNINESEEVKDNNGNIIYNYDSLFTIGYEEINNDFLLYQKGVYSFKNKLISFNNDRYGLIYFAGYDELTITSSFYTYKRLNEHLIKFNSITANENIIDSDNTNNQITLYDDELKNKIFVLWNNNLGSCILQPHYARKYYKLESNYFDSNKQYINLSNYTEKIINLTSSVIASFSENNNFIIVIEYNELDNTGLRDLQNKVKITIEKFKKTIEHLINILPDSYNKEVVDTNYYKLLRAIALVFGDLKYDLDSLKNGFYLNDKDKEEKNKNNEYLIEAKEDTIYNNFGSLIDLPKKDSWSFEKYRKMITAVYKVLLNGPSKPNIQDAVKDFTGYNNNVYELFKQSDNYIFSNLSGIDLTYRFAVQVIKDINTYDDANELMENLIYLLNIIKPAQALFLIYIMFEEYERYDIDNMEEELDVDQYINMKEPKFGMDLLDTLELYNNNEKNILGMKDITKPHNKLAIPKYKITDRYEVEYSLNSKEKYNTKYNDSIDRDSNNNHSTNLLKERYNINYETNEDGTIKTDKYGDPIKKENENIILNGEFNLLENIKQDFQACERHIEKYVCNYNEFIYLPNDNVTYIATNKENLQVYCNGVLLPYNCYDYITNFNYVDGIKLNNNIFKFKDSDIITLIYIKIGTYINTSLSNMNDEVIDSANITLMEKDVLIKSLGFKTLGNLENYSPENIYKLCAGQLSNLKYILLGTLQDREDVVFTINMKARNNKILTNKELEYINFLQENNIKVNIQ